jgi:uncharacterized membrane protein YtjA (UPF0391 family)
MVSADRDEQAGPSRWNTTVAVRSRALGRIDAFDRDRRGHSREPLRRRSTTGVPAPCSNRSQEAFAMLSWALTFFVIALIAAVLGMRGVAGLSAEIGYFFVVLAVIFIVIALVSGRAPSTP